MGSTLSPALVPHHPGRPEETGVRHHPLQPKHWLQPNPWWLEAQPLWDPWLIAGPSWITDAGRLAVRRRATRDFVGWDTGVLRKVLSRKVPKAMPIRLLRAMNRKAFEASLSQESTAPLPVRALTLAFGLSLELALQQLARQIVPQKQPKEKQQPSKAISIQGRPTQAGSPSTEMSPGTTNSMCSPPVVRSKPRPWAKMATKGPSWSSLSSTYTHDLSLPQVNMCSIGKSIDLCPSIVSRSFLQVQIIAGTMSGIPCL